MNFKVNLFFHLYQTSFTPFGFPILIVYSRAWKVVYFPGNTGLNFLAKRMIFANRNGKKDNFCGLIYQTWSKLNQKHIYCSFIPLYLLNPSFGGLTFGLFWITFRVFQSRWPELPGKCLPSWERRSRVPHTFQALHSSRAKLFIKVRYGHVSRGWGGALRGLIRNSFFV